MNNRDRYQIGLVMYPGMTQLDLTAPHQVFTCIPNACVHLLWKNHDAVTSNEGLNILPTTSFKDCPSLDIICVPGGGMGTLEILEDVEFIEFLQQQAKNARYVTSVCTGSLILAAAGLLQGYQAACHWLFREQLAMFGIEVIDARVVIDRNRITGGGVTAGIDFALQVVAQLCGETTAQSIQLMLEYNPAPPFNSGSPATANPAIIDRVKQFGKPLVDATTIAIEKSLKSVDY
jgi:cyclohexyl-isocyanide hydratase